MGRVASDFSRRTCRPWKTQPARGGNVTPVAGQIFETKNQAIFMERFFGRGIFAQEQLSRAKNVARF